MHTEDWIRSWWEREKLLDISEVQPLIITDINELSSSETDDTEEEDL